MTTENTKRRGQTIAGPNGVIHAVAFSAATGAGKYKMTLCGQLLRRRHRKSTPITCLECVAAPEPPPVPVLDKKIDYNERDARLCLALFDKAVT